MPISIGDKPQPDFDEPIALMMDCHRRIERFLTMLLRVVDEVQGQALSQEYRQALETALNYFKSAAPRHTEDEEHSLFPRMRDSGDAAVREALASLDALEADHEAASAHHERVDLLGRRWLTQGRLSHEDTAELAQLLAQLQATYADHIAMEDTVVFPLAQRVLAADALAQVGQEMAQRRALNPGRPGSRCADRRQARATTSPPQ